MADDVPDNLHGSKAFNDSRGSWVEQVTVSLDKSASTGLIRAFVQAGTNGKDDCSQLGLTALQLFQDSLRVQNWTGYLNLAPHGSKGGGYQDPGDCDNHVWYAKATFTEVWPDGSSEVHGPISFSVTLTAC